MDTNNSRLWQQVQHMPSHRSYCAAEDGALLADEWNHSFFQFEVNSPEAVMPHLMVHNNSILMVEEPEVVILRKAVRPKQEKDYPPETSVLLLLLSREPSDSVWFSV